LFSFGASQYAFLPFGFFGDFFFLRAGDFAGLLAEVVFVGLFRALYVRLEGILFLLWFQH
tara:strand:- start:158 stop:337 length:180 start_codon:yes stop_codon:yes gene_type:complete